MPLTGPTTPLGIRTFADGDSPDLSTNGLTLALTDVDALIAALGGYQELSTTLATSSVTDVDLVIFAPATFAAVRHYLEITVPNLRQTAAGNSTFFQLKEGAAAVGNPIQTDAQSAANGAAVSFRLPFVPVAGAHTYKIAWRVSAGTSTLNLTSLAPAAFRIVRAN